MKKWSLRALAYGLLATLLCVLSPATALDDAKPSLKVGLVNFKKCVEESKLGKQEEASFETMKKQMEGVVEEKEKVLNDLAAKLNDPDQLDLMSPEAETELKRKFRALSQELQQLQSQYYQALQQTNFKVVQKISEVVGEAASKVAKENSLDVVLNDETCFYTNTSYDISSLVVKYMDFMFDDEAKQLHSTTPLTQSE